MLLNSTDASRPGPHPGPSTHRRPSKGGRGFALVEILVVMAIAAMMLGMVIFGLSSGRSAESTRAVNQLANSIRYAYDKARVNGEYYRLVLDLDEGSFSLQQADDRMYLPATDRDGRLLVIDKSKQEEMDERDRQVAEEYNRSLAGRLQGAQAPSLDEEVATGGAGDAMGGGAGLDGDPFDPYAVGPREVPRRKPPLFSSFEEENVLPGLSDPFKLPEGFKFVSVRTAEDAEAIVEGQAFLYFFPRGQTQLAHIQLQDPEREETAYTIKVAPLTGRVTISDELVDLELPEDVREVKDELGNEAERRQP